MRGPRFRPLSQSMRDWCPACFRYWRIEMAEKPKIRFAKRPFVLGSRRISCPLCFAMLLPRQFEVAAVALDWNPESESWRSPRDDVPPPARHLVPDEASTVAKSDVDRLSEGVSAVLRPSDNRPG